MFAAAKAAAPAKPKEPAKRPPKISPEKAAKVGVYFIVPVKIID